jgi:hypothetical protein
MRGVILDFRFVEEAETRIGTAKDLKIDAENAKMDSSKILNNSNTND